MKHYKSVWRSRSLLTVNCDNDTWAGILVSYAFYLTPVPCGWSWRWSTSMPRTLCDNKCNQHIELLIWSKCSQSQVYIRLSQVYNRIKSHLPSSYLLSSWQGAGYLVLDRYCSLRKGTYELHHVRTCIVSEDEHDMVDNPSKRSGLARQVLAIHASRIMEHRRHLHVWDGRRGAVHKPPWSAHCLL